MAATAILATAVIKATATVGSNRRRGAAPLSAPESPLPASAVRSDTSPTATGTARSPDEAVPSDADEGGVVNGELPLVWRVEGGHPARGVDAPAWTRRPPP